MAANLVRCALLLAACRWSSAAAAAQKDVHLEMNAKASFASSEAKDEAKNRMMRRHSFDKGASGQEPDATTAAPDADAAATTAAPDADAATTGATTAADTSNTTAATTASDTTATTGGSGTGNNGTVTTGGTTSSSDFHDESPADPTADPQAFKGCVLTGNTAIHCGGAQMMCSCKRNISNHQEDTCCEVVPTHDRPDSPMCRPECRDLGTPALGPPSKLLGATTAAGGTTGAGGNTTAAGGATTAAGGDEATTAAPAAGGDEATTAAPAAGGDEATTEAPAAGSS